jgi:ankyrin repeat protein
VKGTLRYNTNVRSYPKIIQATIAGQHKIVKRCLAGGEDPNRPAVSYMNFTALHWAIALEKLDIGQILIDHGADVDVSAADGKTPLHRAIAKDDCDAVRFLIKNKADIEIGWQENRYDTPISPLKHSILRCDVDIFRLLLHAGADTTFFILDISVGKKVTVTGGLQVHAAGYIARVYSERRVQRDALLDALMQERPDEVLDYWTSQPGP